MMEYIEKNLGVFCPSFDPIVISTELNPKFGSNQGDIKQDTAIQELENIYR